MAETGINISGIAELLKPYREVIAAEWTDLLLQVLPFSEYSAKLRDKLARDALVWVDALLQTMTQIHNREHVLPWSRSPFLYELPGEDYNLSDFVCAWRILAMRVIDNLPLPVLWPSLPDTHTSQLDTVVRQTYSIAKQRESLAVGSFVTEATNKLEIQKGRTALLLEAARAASNTLHLDAILATTGRGIVAATGVQGCLFYLAYEDGNLVARPGYLELDGIATCEAVQINRNLCLALDAAVKPILDQVREQMVPLVCDNAPTDPQIDRVEPLGEAKSFLAVPCLFGGRLEAIALACAFGDAHSFTVEETELAWGIANVAAPAITNARLHEKAKSLAAREERVRLAQEMHDILAQALATLSLKAESALDLLDIGRIEETQTDLRDMKRMADDAFSLVREEIFGLRAFDSLTSRWLPTLRDYLEDYRLYYGLEVRLLIQDESAANLPDTTNVQVFRIIQEALTNVRRHAKATQAWVSFQRHDDGVLIEIKDDGVGFDLAQVMQKSGDHYGLAIMRERVESVGGRITLNSQPGEATRLEVWVPVMEPRGLR